MLLMIVRESGLTLPGVVEAAFWAPATVLPGLITGIDEERAAPAHAAPATTRLPSTALNARFLMFLKLRIPSPPDQDRSTPAAGCKIAKSPGPPAQRRTRRKGYRERLPYLSGCAC